MLVRYFLVPPSPISEALVAFVTASAVMSMAVGNLMALVQTSLKRLLAYSSIAHMGYISVAFLSFGEVAAEAVTFYLLGYTLASVAAFGVIMVLSTEPGRTSDLDRIEDYRGLIRQRPLLGSVLVASLLSFAGIPLTAGFLGKLYVILAGAQEGRWFVLAVLALTSVAGAWYYLRVAVTVCSAATDEAPSHPVPTALSAPTVVVLAVLAVLVVLIGVYPAPVLAVVDLLHN